MRKLRLTRLRPSSSQTGLQHLKNITCILSKPSAKFCRYISYPFYRSTARNSTCARSHVMTTKLGHMQQPKESNALLVDQQRAANADQLHKDICVTVSCNMFNCLSTYKDTMHHHKLCLHLLVCKMKNLSALVLALAVDCNLSVKTQESVNEKLGPRTKTTITTEHLLRV